MTQKLSEDALKHKKESTAKYRKDMYKRITLELPISTLKRKETPFCFNDIKEIAEAHNESVNGFIKTAIKERLDRLKNE